MGSFLLNSKQKGWFSEFLKMSIYNKDELEAPEWLNKDFIQGVLRNYEKEDGLEVINMTTTPATLKGDHFASCMFRAKVEYRNGSSSSNSTCKLIIKAMPELDSVKAQFLGDLKLFETEISMYSETIPKFEKILAEYGDIVKFGPKVLYTSLEPIKLIIFEDLCEGGYDALRGRYLKIDELKKVLLKLAKFHAVSYKISKSDKAEEVTKYQDGLFNTQQIFENEMMSGGLKRFIRLLEQEEELRTYLPKFKGIEEKLKQGCIDLYNAYKNGEKDEIFVLNHGDFHLRNLMFKCDEENDVEDVMMVDFQLCVFGPSTIDLTYSMYMIFDPVSLRENRDELMHFYFEHFIDTLKKIDFQGELPSYTQFQISTLKHRYLSIYMLTTFYPMIFAMAAAKPEDLTDFELTEIINSDDVLMASYMNPTFIAELKRYLPVLLNSGFLN